MRKGFTKIPNSIAELSLPMEVVGLYTWLSVHADRDGRVVMSLNKISRATHLSKMQVRRYLEKLRVTQLATQQTTQPATQLPNVTTICFLSSCEQKKEKSDTACDTASDIGSDTPRAYKNDNINIMSYKTKEDRIISPNVEIITHTQSSACEAFHEWLSKECPYIATHYKLLTEEEFAKLKAAYGSQAIADVCSNIENRKDLRKKYTNLYRTLLNWLKRNNHATTQTTQQSYHDSDHPTNDELRQQTADYIASRLAQD